MGKKNKNKKKQAQAPKVETKQDDVTVGTPVAETPAGKLFVRLLWEKQNLVGIILLTRIL